MRTKGKFGRLLHSMAGQAPHKTPPGVPESFMEQRMGKSLSSQVSDLESEVEVLRERVKELEAMPHPEEGLTYFSRDEDGVGSIGIKVILADWDVGHLFIDLEKVVSDEAEEIAERLHEGSAKWADDLAQAFEASAAKIRSAFNAKA